MRAWPEAQSGGGAKEPGLWYWASIQAWPEARSRGVGGVGGNVAKNAEPGSWHMGAAYGSHMGISGARWGHGPQGPQGFQGRLGYRVLAESRARGHCPRAHPGPKIKQK